MFEGLARKFFYVTAASGVLASGSGIFGAPQKVNAFVKEVQELRREAIAASKAKPAHDFGDTRPPTEAQFEEPKTNINGQEFVVIRGKYYKYRKDHIYMVNGQKLYFQNNREITKAPLGVRVAQADIKRDTAGYVPEASTMASDSPQLPIPKNLPVDDSVMSPTEALKKMRELQQQMSERNNFLNSLETDGR